MEYRALHIMNQTLFVGNNNTISIIMHFLHIFVLVCNVILWEEIRQVPLDLRPTYLLLRSKIRSNLHFGPDTGGECFAVLL